MQYRNHLLHPLTALIFLTMTSCQSELPKEADTHIMVFNLALPSGEEVDYIRNADTAPHHDATEWKITTLKVYTFIPNEAGIPVFHQKQEMEVKESNTGACIQTSEARYTASIPVNTTTTYMAFIANDNCTALDAELKAGVSTPDDLRQSLSDKIITGQSADHLMKNPDGLCMTGELSALTTGGKPLNKGGEVTLSRIMARLDVKDYMSANYDFRLEKVRVVYSTGNGAPQGCLFQQWTKDIWNTAGEMEVRQNSIYDTYGYLPYGTPGYPDDSWVGETAANGHTGTWYKKVLYFYELPRSRNGEAILPPVLEITYLLNGARGTRRIAMRNRYGNPIDLERNHVYTLQTGSTETEPGEVKFTFTDQPWQVHVMDINLNTGNDATTNE